MKKKTKPNTLCCYICGQHYGTSSLEFHLRFCIQKFIRRESLKLPQDRQLIPNPPENIHEILNGENLSGIIEKYNQEANEYFNKEVLTPCKNCLRTFEPEALKKHQMLCTENRYYNTPGDKIKKEIKHKWMVSQNYYRQLHHKDYFLKWDDEDDVPEVNKWWRERREISEFIPSFVYEQGGKFTQKNLHYSKVNFNKCTNNSIYEDDDDNDSNIDQLYKQYHDPETPY